MDDFSSRTYSIRRSIFLRPGCKNPGEGRRFVGDGILQGIIMEFIKVMVRKKYKMVDSMFREMKSKGFHLVPSILYILIMHMISNLEMPIEIEIEKRFPTQSWSIES